MGHAEPCRDRNRREPRLSANVRTPQVRRRPRVNERVSRLFRCRLRSLRDRCRFDGRLKRTPPRNVLWPRSGDIAEKSAQRYAHCDDTT